MLNPRWVAVHWGQRQARLWALGADDEVLAERRLEQPCPAPEQAATALLAATADWYDPGRPPDILCAGPAPATPAALAGALRPVPAPVLAPEACAEVATGHLGHPGLRLRLTRGMVQKNPVDMIQQDTLRIAGFLAAKPDFDGVLCLPGATSRWVRLSAGEVVGFASFATGALAGLMATADPWQAVQGGDGDDPELADSFAAAVSEATARPALVSARLAGLAAEIRLAGLAPDLVRARLSGLLIGLEIAGARPWWLGMELALSGAADLCRRYQQALEIQGATAPIHDPGKDTAAAVLDGLRALHARCP